MKSTIYSEDGRPLGGEIEFNHGDPFIEGTLETILTFDQEGVIPPQNAQRPPYDAAEWMRMMLAGQVVLVEGKPYRITMLVARNDFFHELGAEKSAKPFQTHVEVRLDALGGETRGEPNQAVE